MNTQPPLQSVEVGEHPRTDFGHLRVVVGGEEVLEGVGEQSGCHTVTQPVPVAGPVRSDWVTKALLKALISWSEKRDANELRRALGQLIAVL